MRKLRLGIIGVGARGIHNAKAVNAREDVEFVGVCDVNPERLKACDAERIAGKRFTDYRELLDCGLDAVCINTANNVHAEQTIAAAKRGCHVYCEKPIALSLKDAEAMVKACRNVATVVNLSMRLAPEHRHLQRLVKEGAWGRLLALGAAHPKPSGLLCQGKGHKATLAPDVWGPLLLHDGVHICEWLRFIGGEVASVFARTVSTGPDPANEELISAITIHENGAMGNLSYMTMPFMDRRQYVICEKASAWPARDKEGPCIIVNRVGQAEERVRVPVPKLTGDAAAVDEFIRAIRDGHRPYATMEDGLAGQRIVEAIRRSAGEGAVVRV
jgi:predicted dehydrogenase